MDLSRLKKGITNLRREVMELSCEGCKKGPCIGRLKPGETGYTFRGSLYIHNGYFYLRGCSMIRRDPNTHLPVEVKNNNGVLSIDAPTMEISVEDHIGLKDIRVGE